MKLSAKSFLEMFFWLAGSFCAYTLTCAAQAVLRFKSVDLPIFGQCSEMEGAIYTLTLLAPLLGMLHFFVHRYQGLCRQDGDVRPHFPGSIQEHTVPKELKELRVALFFLLLIWPTLAYGICTERVFRYYRIIPNSQLAEKCPNGSVVLGDMLTYPWPNPPGSKANENHWWVNTYTEEKDENGHRIKVSPLPFQPLAFGLACSAFAGSTLLTLYRGLAGKKWPWKVRRPKPAPGAEPPKPEPRS